MAVGAIPSHRLVFLQDHLLSIWKRVRLYPALSALASLSQNSHIKTDNLTAHRKIEILRKHKLWFFCTELHTNANLQSLILSTIFFNLYKRCSPYLGYPWRASIIYFPVLKVSNVEMQTAHVILWSTISKIKVGFRHC